MSKYGNNMLTVVTGLFLEIYKPRLDIYRFSDNTRFAYRIFILIFGTNKNSNKSILLSSNPSHADVYVMVERGDRVHSPKAAVIAIVSERFYSNFHTRELDKQAAIFADSP